MINKERVELWIEALRSNKYKQGKRYLKRDDEYCCLGVACDISGIGYWKEQPTGNKIHSYEDKYNTGLYGALPLKVQEWFNFGSEFTSTEFYKLNDEENKTFIEIADYIENKYLKE